MKSGTAILVAAVLLLPAGFARASLVEYSFTGNSLSPTSIDANLVSHDFGASAALTGVQFFALNTTANTTSGAPARQVGGGNADGGTWGTSFNALNYYTLTVEPVSGKALTLTSLTLFVSKNANGANTWFVRSNVDSFAADLGAGTGIYQGSPGNDPWTFVNVALSMSNIAAPVEFRIYGYNGTTGNFRIDDVTVNGSVVPEPATLALLGIGGMLMFARRRKA